jgi:adenosine deaminase
MLDCFSIFLPCVRGDLQSVEELSYRFVGAQARENIAYTEVRYSPHLSFGRGKFRDELPIATTLFK